MARVFNLCKNDKMKRVIPAALSSVRIPKPRIRKRKLSAEETRANFEERLRQMFWSEKGLSEVLPNLARLSTSYELTSAILGHLAVTENQIIRLIHIFDVIGERAVGVKHDEAAKIIEASQDIAISDAGYYRDAEIIHCCQKLMHHEISNYTALLADAIDLSEDLAAEFLAMAIKEEKNAHARLSEISLSSIYFDAAS